LYFSIIAALVSLLAGSPARAFIQTVTPSGEPVRWTGSRTLNLAGNPTNSSGIAASDFFAAVTTGLERWKSASQGQVNFGYWQGTDPGTYIPNSNYNGLSSIYFASNANPGQSLSTNVLGLTQVWYNSTTGEVLESDTVLNDVNFHFTMNPSDTSGYGSTTAGAGSASKPNVYIENVITHELGHAFGLSHSGSLQSTMLYMESPEQAHLGCDENAAIRAIYPDSSGSAGTLSGQVLTPTGSPLYGAHVQAISRRRGTVLATGLSDHNGHYAISGLEPGTYFVMAEPFYAGSASLPSYYGGIDSAVCSGGENFGRTVLTDSSGYVPAGVGVTGAGVAQAPALTVRCGTGGSAGISGPQTSDAVIYSGGSGFGVTDELSSTSVASFQLQALSGSVEIHILSYSLYSPVRPSVALISSTGQVVAQSSDPVYEGDSGYTNYDSAITTSVEPGNYTLQVSLSPLGSSLYPAGPIMIDAERFFVVTGSVGEAAPALAATLPVNARCRMAENFPAYQSPAGSPPRIDTSQGQGGGGCGTIEAESPRGGRGRGGPRGGGGPGAIAGWFAPWLAMAAIARLARRRRKSLAPSEESPSPSVPGLAVQQAGG
jgi:hypothetical protein